MIFLFFFLFSVGGHFVNEIRQKEQTRSKKTKIMIFLFFFEDTHKNVDFERVLKKNKKEEKDKGHLGVFPAA